VINAAAAQRLEAMVQATVEAGGRIIAGGKRVDALLEPTVIENTPRASILAKCEAFGPLAPIMPVKDLEDAIELSNATPYGLSCGVVTTNMKSAIRAVQGVRAGTVNVNEVPGFRIECSPFGGVKDSGLGIKEGVIEAMKFMSTVKTYSLPWS
jgi:aldehyde dehydrogenase (NAD+)